MSGNFSSTKSFEELIKELEDYKKILDKHCDLFLNFVDEGIYLEVDPEDINRIQVFEIEEALDEVINNFPTKTLNQEQLFEKNIVHDKGILLEVMIKLCGIYEFLDQEKFRLDAANFNYNYYSKTLRKLAKYLREGIRDPNLFKLKSESEVFLEKKLDFQAEDSQKHSESEVFLEKKLDLQVEVGQECFKEHFPKKILSTEIVLFFFLSLTLASYYYWRSKSFKTKSNI